MLIVNFVNNNNSNNSSGAVVRVYRVYLMNIEQCHLASDPQTKSSTLVHESASRLLSCIPNVTLYYHHYSVQILTLRLLSHHSVKDKRLS